MPEAGFESTIPASERAKALDRAATVLNNIVKNHYSLLFVTFALSLVSHVIAISALT